MMFITFIKEKFLEKLANDMLIKLFPKSLEETVQDNMLTEMAKGLKEYKELVSDLLLQIVDNWCLVCWCIENPKEQKSILLRNHWTSELRAYLHRTNKYKIKVHNRKKAVEDVVYNWMELNDITTISKKISYKFKKEGLSEYIRPMAEEWCACVKDIITIISDSSDEEIEDYIDNDLQLF